MGYGAVGERVVNSALRIEAAPIYHIRTHRIHSYLRDALHLPVRTELAVFYPFTGICYGHVGSYSRDVLEKEI